MKTFREELREYLEKTNIKPSHLARAAGISPSIISLYLAEKRSMTVDTSEKIKAAMQKAS